MTPLEILKFNIRETQYPYFSDEELQYLLDKNEDDIDKASYEALILKAEDDAIKIPGLDYSGSKEYFLRLACRFRTNYSGTIKRADEDYA